MFIVDLCKAVREFPKEDKKVSEVTLNCEIKIYGSQRKGIEKCSREASLRLFAHELVKSLF